jgi:UDP-N-acetylglucosamine--N-acetylmuramyl-(pentapeptide) pyrophosphoryl-undecaprenol N-acetylglucosamine transferase
MTRRIAFAVGDTAGHVMPALAIAEAYEALAPDVSVRFYAAPGGPATRLAARAGRPLVHVAASAVARAGLVARLVALGRVARALPAVRAQLGEDGARLVVGTGGYASGPVLLAARSLGLATAIVEPNAVPGLANRWLRRWVDRAYVGADDTAHQLAPAPALVTGTPVVAAMVAGLAALREAPEPGGATRVLVTGASRGEQFLGSEAPALLAAVAARGVRVHVWHQAGALDLATLERAYAQHDVEAIVTDFVDDMAAAYRWADFVIGRAGAGTIAELGLAALPALLVPLSDAAADHQSVNAARHAERGAAIWVREAAWQRQQIAGDVAALLGSADRWRAMSAAARATARPDAAAAIVADCERLMVGRW